MRKKAVCIMVIAILIAAMLPGKAVAEGVPSFYSGFYGIGSDPNVTVTPESSAGDPVTPISVDVDGDGTEETLYNGSDKLKVELSGATVGAQYMVFLVEGDEIPTVSTAIYYIDQKAGGESVVFNVFPKLPGKNNNMSLIITSNAAGFTTKKISVSFATAGYMVSGTAAFWNDTDNAEYYLYSAETADADIRAAWQAGTHTELAGIEDYAVTKGEIEAATVDGKSMKAQSFSFEAVKAGEYKLAIFKPGKYVPKIVTVTITDEAVELGSVKLWLYGDVNCDGKVRAGDATQIYKYVAKTRTFTENELLAADITGDGKVRAGDATQIYKYVAKMASMFDNYK